MDLVTLKSEIETDPAGVGYGAQSDDQVARLLNRVRNQDAGNPNFEINRKEVLGADIASAMVPAEFITLSVANRDYIAMLTNGDGLTASRFRSNLLALFPSGSFPLTRSALDEVFKKQVSRAQKLFNEDVTPSQVADARRLP